MMSAFKACGIISGRIDWTDPREYLEAALYISIHNASCKGMLTLPQFALAIRLADYAVDNGEAKAVAVIKETQDENKKALH